MQNVCLLAGLRDQKAKIWYSWKIWAYDPFLGPDTARFTARQETPQPLRRGLCCGFGSGAVDVPKGAEPIWTGISLLGVVSNTKTKGMIRNVYFPEQGSLKGKIANHSKQNRVIRGIQAPN